MVSRLVGMLMVVLVTEAHTKNRECTKTTLAMSLTITG